MKQSGIDRKNKGKRSPVRGLLSAVLVCALLLVPALQIFSFAEELESDGWTYEVNGNGITITGYTGGYSDVAVPSKIDGKSVVAIGDEALKGNADIVNVTVPEGVVTVGEEAFADCPNLESVVLPESVTALGRRTFRYSMSLRSVTLPSTLSQFPYQGFWECRDLRSIVIPDGVTTIPNGAFYYCIALRSVTVPDSVTSIDVNAFHACWKLESLDLSEKVTAIDKDAFSDCDYLAISAPEGSVADVFAHTYGYLPENAILESPHPYYDDDVWEYTYDGEAAALKVTFSPKCYFYGGWGLDEFTVTDEEGNQFVFTQDELAGKTLVLKGTSFTLDLKAFFSEVDFGFRITGIEPMTQQQYEDHLAALDADPWEAHVVNGTLEITGYRGLRKDAVIPAEINGISVVSIAPYAFQNNMILQNVVISEGVQTIGEGAFMECKNLETIQLPRSLTEIHDMAFYICLSLKEIEIPDGVTVLQASVFNDCEALEKIVLPEGLKSIEAWGLSYCLSLTGVDLPEGLVSLGDRAFYGSALTELAIPAGVTRIPQEMCGSCEDLTKVSLPAGIVEIGNRAFSGCVSLGEITLPAALTRIGSSAFSSTSLTEITIPAGVDTLGSGAFGATRLTSVYIPAGVTTMGENPVINCELLTKITVDEANPNYASKDNIVFNKAGDTMLFAAPGIEGEFVIPEGTVKIVQSGCSSMKKITRAVLPGTLTELGGGAFHMCSALESVEIRSGLTRIPDMAFAYCPALKEIEIPDTVTMIDAGAFNYCTALSGVTLPAGLEQIGAGAFMYCNLEEITVPDGIFYLDSYVFASNPGLKRAVIPDSVQVIIWSVFMNCPDVTVFASKDSAAFAFALEEGITAIDPPGAVEGLVENGAPQALVTPGTASRGTLCYAVETDKDAVPGADDYSGSLPAAAEPGSYYVWYKATAGGKDTVETVLTVTVAADEAKTVKETIESLPAAEELSLSDRTAVDAARAAYNALTDEDKARVDENALQKLSDAEAALDSMDYTLCEMGGNGAWVKGGKDGLTAVVKSAGADDSFEHFLGAQIDGRALVRGTDYTVKKGSTVVTLFPAALEKLSAGEHTLTLVFDNGVVNTGFTVRAAASSPHTGDDGDLGLYLAFMALCGAAALLFAFGAKKKKSVKK